MLRGKKTWGHDQKGTEQQRETPGREAPRSAPGGWSRAAETRSAHHVLRQTRQEALVQDLCRDLLHFFFPLVPGQIRKPHTGSSHQHKGSVSALGALTLRVGYPRLLPDVPSHTPLCPWRNRSSFPNELQSKPSPPDC